MNAKRLEEMLKAGGANVISAEDLFGNKGTIEGVLNGLKEMFNPGPAKKPIGIIPPELMNDFHSFYTAKEEEHNRLADIGAQKALEKNAELQALMDAYMEGVQDELQLDPTWLSIIERGDKLWAQVYSHLGLNEEQSNRNHTIDRESGIVYEVETEEGEPCDHCGKVHAKDNHTDGDDDAQVTSPTVND